MLLTDIFAGLSVLSLFHPGRCMASRISTAREDLAVRSSPPSPPRPTAPRSACCSACAASAGSRGRCCARGSPLAGLVQGSLTHRRRRRDAARGQFRAVGTIGLDARRLRRRLRPHAAGRHRHALSRTIIARSEKLKLCPYRNELPATADEFLWGNSMFNTLGRFQGMNDEMGYHRAAFARRLSGLAGRGRARRDRASNWCMSATGEGTNGWIPHTYGIIERYIPAQIKADARGASAALGHQFRRDQPAACSGRAGLDAAGVRDLRARALAPPARRSRRCWRRPSRWRCSATPSSAA